MIEFEITLEKMKKLLNVSKDADVAEAIGMKPSAFANRKKAGSIPFSHYLKIIKSQNVNLNWFIYDEGPIYKDKISQPENPIDVSEKRNKSVSAQSNLTKIIIEHQDMVKRFKDPERAKEINENLIEIEDLSEELINSIASHIKSSLNAAKIVKGVSKKKGSPVTKKRANGE